MNARKYLLAELQALEDSRQRPPGYVDAYRRAAIKEGDGWLLIDDEEQLALIQRYRPQPIPGEFDIEAERRRLKQGGCCGTPSDAK